MFPQAKVAAAIASTKVGFYSGHKSYRRCILGFLW
jgi:hypothetical protein